MIQKLSRTIQASLGIVFLFAGLIKVWEPVLFYWNILPHTQFLGIGQRLWPLAARAGLFLGPFECALGAALILNWRSKIMFPITVLLTVFFLGLMTYVWYLKIGVNCGCFGNLVERGPGEAAIEDAIMLFLIAFSWWGLRQQKVIPSKIKTWSVIGILMLSIFVGGIRFIPSMNRLHQSDLMVGTRLTGLKVAESDLDLLKGSYLIELFSPNCKRCERFVTNLNQWTKIQAMPPIIGLSADNQIGKFIETMQPRYRIGKISRIDFLRLTWRHGYPRIAYVHNGVVQAVWDYPNIPTWQSIVKQHNASRQQ